MLPADAFAQERARRRLLNFTTYTMPDYKVSWHHEVICRELDALIRGEATRLMLCMPPRHGKSELVSRRLPAYILGKDPDAEIIAASYSSDLASRMNRDVQRIMDCEAYQRVFPGTKLSGSNVHTVAHGSYLRNSDIFEVVNHRGVYRSAGVGGGITGMGAKYAIIDDPFRNRKDANSQTIRETVWDWYTSTLYTRLSPDGRVLLVMTRWHEDDLAGRLIEQMTGEDAEDWRIISFPATAEPGREDTHAEDLREDGEPLWPTRYDGKKLDRIKRVIGSYEWAGLFQQRPAPAEGAIFLRQWWKYWSEQPRLVTFDEIIQSWDCTFKGTDGTDYVVGQVWGKRGADRYLLDQVRARMDFPRTIREIKALKAKWPSSGAILVEDKANGPAVIATLSRDIPGLIPVEPRGGKVVRAQAVTAQVESGNVFLPSPERCAWVGDFLEEITAFPNGKHDDQVDAMTQALTRLMEQHEAEWGERPGWA